MAHRQSRSILGTAGILAAVVFLVTQAGPAQEKEAGGHVPEVKALLSHLQIDAPRTHKNMVVFPIRWSGTQAPGRWMTLDEAVAAGRLKIIEKDQATVEEVQVENLGDQSVLLMSGEIISGGKQTRVVRRDTLVEARQRVAIAVFCVEQHRWSDGKEFKASGNMAPASVQDQIKRGADQGRVWSDVRNIAGGVGESSPTESVNDVIESPKVQEGYKKAHDDLGKFSPPDTIGIAIGDTRTGRIVGLELFGRRDLFESLQEKLIEGYTLDLVLAAGKDGGETHEITEKDVRAFIDRALAGTSRYEDTSGSGRGLDLESGSLHGKGTAVGETVIHLSIQNLGVPVTPARPNVDPPPRRMGGQE